MADNPGLGKDQSLADLYDAAKSKHPEGRLGLQSIKENCPELEGQCNF